MLPCCACVRTIRLAGKVLCQGTRHVENRAATGLRMTPTSLWCSKTYLGANRHRLRARPGVPKAITAMADMLARLVYRMLRCGEQYVYKWIKYCEEKYREHESRSIQKKANHLGFVVILTPNRRIRKVPAERELCTIGMNLGSWTPSTTLDKAVGAQAA